MDDIDEADRPPTPESRILEGAAGVPVILGDGATWCLADGGLCNHLDEVRDRLADASTLTNSVAVADVLEAAVDLLVANFELTFPEAARLLTGAEAQGLTTATMEALFGPEKPRRTYTSWAASGMLANGIDPASVPSSLRSQVMDHLVYSRRAIPMDKFVESAEAAPRLAAFRALARRATPAPPPGPEAP